MIWYPTQSHCPDTHPTSPCHILIMPSAWLGNNKSLFKSHWFDSPRGGTHDVRNPRSPKTEYRSRNRRWYMNKHQTADDIHSARADDRTQADGECAPTCAEQFNNNWWAEVTRSRGHDLSPPTTPRGSLTDCRKSKPFYLVCFQLFTNIIHLFIIVMFSYA